MIDRKELAGEDFCWRDGWEDWKEVKEIYNMPTTVLPPKPPQTRKKSPKNIKVEDSSWNTKTFIRDGVIVMILNLLMGTIGAFIAMGVNIGEQNVYFGLIAMTFKMSGETIGFAICSALHKGNPWKHLLYVAIFVWLYGITYIIQGKTTFVEFIFEAPLVFGVMAIGGSLGLYFKKDN